MATIVTVENISKSLGDRTLFTDIGFGIEEGDKIGLIARNGTGKSTLMSIIAGVQSPDSGQVVCRNGLRIGYLPQQPEFSSGSTVLSAAMEHSGDIASTVLAYENAIATDNREAIHTLTASMDAISAWDYKDKLHQVLGQLGLFDMSQPVAQLSGGQRKRLAIARLVMQQADFLLLDEPTNHLDIESIQWLENFLITKANAVVLVSHDRAFIDNVTNRTIEISLGKIYDYSVNYSKYVVLRQERLEQQMRAFQNQQKMIKDTEDFIERFRYKATKSVQVQSRIKQLAKIDRIEVDEVDTSHLNLKFPPAPRSGDYPVIADNVGKTYGDHQVFDGATFTIKRGEKVAFVGKNGEGKSTLVKCIMNEIPFTGNLKIGHNVKIGYFAQNQAQLLDGEISVFDTIDRVAVGDIRTKIRDILGAFMFGGEDSDKKVKVLSGGEKTRLAMIRLLLDPVNLLILDEPTNHLDMKTKDILKNAIKDFDGTVIVVSHDREFLDGLVEKVYEFGGGQVRECLGGIYEFLEKKKIASLAELERNAPKAQQEKDSKNSAKGSGAKSSVANTAEKSAQEQKAANAEARKLSYAEQREHEKLVRKARKKVEEAEAEVGRLEQEVADIETIISAGDPPADIYDRHAAATKQLENAMSLWELASLELDEISGQ